MLKLLIGKKSRVNVGNIPVILRRHYVSLSVDSATGPEEDSKDCKIKIFIKQVTPSYLDREIVSLTSENINSFNCPHIKQASWQLITWFRDA